ncbi:MAG: CYTH domain-containing protein [Oscillospiraceae bacterium]|nr:CYTH domain-containing protein [Oscillospiraceae bacterium]
MLEKELKCLISQKKYEEIFSSLDWRETIIQDNFYFFDRKGVLKKNKINVRVRKIEDDFFLQIKTPVKDDKGLSVSREYEKVIPSLPTEISGKELREIAGLELEIDKAVLAGVLKTKRHFCQWDEDTLVCLDESSYLEIVDYEIEVEFSKDHVDQDLIDLLKSKEVDFDHKARGKRSRFINRFNELKRNEKDML